MKPGTKALEDLPLNEIRKYNPELEKSLREKAFEKAKDADGFTAVQNVVKKSFKGIFPG